MHWKESALREPGQRRLSSTKKIDTIRDVYKCSDQHRKGVGTSNNRSYQLGIYQVRLT